MNVTELARKLKVTTKELLEVLPVVGFDIGKRAIKIDDRQAQKVIEKWPMLKAQYRESIEGAKPLEEKLAATKPVEEKTVSLPPFISVKDFAEKLKLPLAKVMGELIKNGVLSSMNEKIDFDTASIIGQELGYEVSADNESHLEKEKSTSEKLAGLLNEEDEAKLKGRPPVIVVMGHVDHGKTKLLDAIRKTNVMGGESGGITQHIGAYQVEKHGKSLTFIDTPGHEAFTTMRSRGARVADIAILVIAADDSIQPQTKESIRIIKSAELPMIVAINKIDKPDANPEKVKTDLASLDLVPEEWGGKTICVPISAKQGTGIDELLEMILLVAETEKESIMANPEKPAVGTIVESRVDRGEGPVATCLIQNGTLKQGDLIEIGGTFYGKVRAMKDYKGQEIKIASPSTPVKIIGLKAAPSVGDILQVIEAVDKKQKVKKYQMNQQAVDYTRPISPKKSDEESIKSFNIVLKADVLGSLEAIIASLTKIEHPEVTINIISKGLGNITENDIKRAEAGHAVILGFHIKMTSAAENSAKERKVEVLLYDIIYRLLDEAKIRLEKLISPEVVKTELGRLKVLAIFRKEEKSMVIGGSVTKGKIVAHTKVDVWRDKVKLATGHIDQVQVNKVAVNEATQGQECGLKYSGKPVAAAGDILEVYLEEVKVKKIS